MRRIKLIITFLILTFSNIPTFACSCAKAGILKCQNKSDFVFTGKVIRINEIITREKITGTEEIVDYKRYEFVFEIRQIHKKLKDFKSSDNITIITSGGGADCGNRFNLNKQYLVYSYKQNHKIGSNLEDQKTDSEFMSTNLCTRTKKISFFSFLEQLILELT